MEIRSYELKLPKRQNLIHFVQQLLMYYYKGHLAMQTNEKDATARSANVQPP